MRLGSGGPDAAPPATVITLCVPASPCRLPTVRAVAAAGATAAGLATDEVRDIRDALERIAAMLVDRAAPGSSLDCRITGGPGTLLVRLEAVTVPGALPARARCPLAPTLTERAAAFRAAFDGLAGGHPTVVDLRWSRPD